jgi:hypothetical protein
VSNEDLPPGSEVEAGELELAPDVAVLLDPARGAARALEDPVERARARVFKRVALIRKLPAFSRQIFKLAVGDRSHDGFLHQVAAMLALLLERVALRLEDRRQLVVVRELLR